jgi:hypothetical protein
MPIFLLTILVFCYPLHTVAQISPEPPPLVRFTGSLRSPTDTKLTGFSTLNVAIKETKWRMRIAKVEKLTGRSPSGTRLLESIFPRQLHFTGPEHLLNALRDPQIEGHIISVEGRLYVRDHMFLVTEVSNNSATND